MSDQQPKQKSAVAPKSKAMGVRGHRIRDLAKTEERRREILLGAARAFARSGYDATNMDQIARECGLAKGHIYHYFLSKEDIFSEIRTDAISRAIDQLSAIARGSNDDPELTLQKAISALIAWVFEQAGRYEPVLARSGVAKPGQSKTHTDLVAGYEQMFASILRRGIDKGIFVQSDPKLMTFVILRAANTVAGWYREGGKWKPKWIVEKRSPTSQSEASRPNNTFREAESDTTLVLLRCFRAGPPGSR